MEREFRERVWRLLGDYASSYDPDGAEYEYLTASDGDSDPVLPDLSGSRQGC